jgi:uncharacterized protein (DUF1810 family)
VTGLERFVEAQERGGTYAQALAELRAGRKQGHWIWFVLPQLAGLGRSPAARTYGLRDLDEARAYLAHPVLGARLRECVQVLLDLPDDDPVAVLASDVDAVKLRSCLTLFGRAAPEDPRFSALLARWYAGQEDDATLALLADR